MGQVTFRMLRWRSAYWACHESDGHALATLPANDTDWANARSISQELGLGKGDMIQRNCVSANNTAANYI